MGEVLRCSQRRPSAQVVARVADVLASGGVVVLPTDSVYGLCCAAQEGNPAHGRIFAMKGRDRAQTLPWFVADAADLLAYGRDVPGWALRAAEAFWPGALTLVVRASAAVPAEYAQPGRDGEPATIALRVPGSPLVRAVVRELGSPLAQTSANTHGLAAATSGADVEPVLAAAADLVVDAGPAPLAQASTIVDATGPEPRVLREGALVAADVLVACRP